MKNRLHAHPLPVIFFTLLVNALGFGILIPVIPQLLANPHSPYFLLPSGFNISQGYILLGFLTAIFPIMQFFATPILGQLSDKYGRKYVLAFSLAGTFFSYMMFMLGILTQNLPLLFFSRAFDGITGGNISVAQAAIADITSPENRAKNFGLIGAAFGLGFVLGPYLGGKLSDPAVVPWFNASTPFLFAGILGFFNTLAVIFFFSETLQTKQHHLVIQWHKSVHNIIRAYSEKHLRPLFTTTLLFQGGFTFFTTFFSVFLIRRFQFSQGNIGDFFSYVGIWIAISQIVITRQVAKFLSEAQIVKLSIIVASLSIFLYFLPTHGWQLLFVVPFFAAGIGVTNANLTALISKSVDRHIQGEILGVNASVMALAQSVPPILSGYIAASLSPETPVLVSAVVVLTGALFFIFFYKPSFVKEAMVNSEE